MMMAVNFLLNDDSLTVILGGKPHIVGKQNSKYKQVRQALVSASTTEQDIKDILKTYDTVVTKDNRKVAGTWLDGKLVLKSGTLYYNGEQVHQNLQKRFLQVVEEGLPVESIANFIANIELNPSSGARGELYDFLTHTNLALTEDGCILAYKAVTSDFKDKHTRKLDNSVGQLVSMKRKQVDDDRRHDCSYGLHVGALEYVSRFGSSGDKCVRVKVHPRDVVAVPYDYDCQKMRVCKYLVLDEYKGEMTRAVYKADGTSFMPEKYDAVTKEEEDKFDYDSFEDSYSWGDVESEPEMTNEEKFWDDREDF